MQIYSVHDFDAKSAARDFLREGIVAVDDVSANLYDLAREELFHQLGHATDAFDIKTQRVPTYVGPVFVFRDASRISAKQARMFVLAQFPDPKTLGAARARRR